MKTEELHAYAKQLALHLGDSWVWLETDNVTQSTTAYPENKPYSELKYGAVLREESTGAKIHVNHDSYRKKIYISASTDYHYGNERINMPYGFELSKMSVSIGRTASAVAKEIQRKIVDNARLAAQHWEDVCKRIDETNYAQKRAIDILNSAHPGTVRDSKFHDGNNDSAYLYVDGYDGRLSAGSCRFDRINCNPEQAVELIALIKSWKKD